MGYGRIGKLRLYNSIGLDKMHNVESSNNRTWVEFNSLTRPYNISPYALVSVHIGIYSKLFIYHVTHTIVIF